MNHFSEILGSTAHFQTKYSAQLMAKPSTTSMIECWRMKSVATQISTAMIVSRFFVRGRM